jgi:hypothetical protein
LGNLFAAGKSLIMFERAHIFRPNTETNFSTDFRVFRVFRGSCLGHLHLSCQFQDYRFAFWAALLQVLCARCELEQIRWNTPLHEKNFSVTSSSPIFRQLRHFNDFRGMGSWG